MNHKQKFGYIVLGAVIMLIGMGIGSTFFPPPLIAHQDSVFDTITCRNLGVVDENGNLRIRLSSNHPLRKDITVFNENGKERIILTGSDFLMGNGIKVYGENSKLGISLFSSNILGNSISVRNRSSELGGVSLWTRDNSTPMPKELNGITISDPAGKMSFQIYASLDSNELIVRDKSSGEGIGFYGDSNETKQTRWYPPPPKEEKR